VWQFIGTAVHYCRLFIVVAIPAVCSPCGLSSSIHGYHHHQHLQFPYEQWLIGRLVVLVTWQWWQQMLLLGPWGLLAVVMQEQNLLLPCEQRLAAAV
jgi:uncharacterized membrane protein